MKQGKVEFPITLWPGMKLPLPTLDRARYRLERSGEVLLPLSAEAIVKDFPQVAAEVAEVQPIIDVGEIYLDLATLDLDDDEAILRFANQYGIFGMYEAGRGWPYVDLLSGDLVAQMEASRLAAASVIAESEGLDPKRAREAAFNTGPVVNETLTEFRTGARLLRDALTAWRHLRGELKSADVRWEFLDPGYPSSLVSAEELLWGGLDAGLAPFSPGFYLGADLAEVDPNGQWEATVVPTREIPPRAEGLFPRCCLELYNHMVEQAEYRECANPTCRRLFVRQRSHGVRNGSHYGQHRRKGVRYCSPRCARLQAVRSHRQRAAEKKRKAKPPARRKK
jgi:hypothetical protein